MRRPGWAVDRRLGQRHEPRRVGDGARGQGAGPGHGVGDVGIVDFGEAIEQLLAHGSITGNVLEPERNQSDLVKLGAGRIALRDHGVQILACPLGFAAFGEEHAPANPGWR